MVNSFEGTTKIKTAVVMGHHPIDVPAFHALLRSMPEVDFYPQHMEDFVSDVGEVRRHYDVVVFYNFHMATPGNEKDWWDRRTREALEGLGEGEQGIFVLHHAILAYPQWDPWGGICGIEDRGSFSYFDSVAIRVEIADPDHPVTRGLTTWEMVDETYIAAEPDADSHVLLTTNHPKSMKALAWTRQYRNARVFCLQSGHDSSAYADPNFRTVVYRGIQWLAARI